MKKYKVLFADLDGTLIDTVSGDTFPKGIWDMRIRLDVLDAIKELGPQCVVIVTNQGGIEKGFVNRRNFEFKMEYLIRSIKEYTGCYTEYSYCESNDKANHYRKPNTGMLERMMARIPKLLFCLDNLAKDDCLMIGDASGKEGQFSDSDKKTAENFGIDYLDVEDFVKEMRIVSLQTMSFKYPISTTIEQSEHLLALGVKPETADMCLGEKYGIEICVPYCDMDNHNQPYYRPAWSIVRLLEMMPTAIENDYCSAGLQVTPPVIQYWSFDKEESYAIFNRTDIFDNAISCIEWLIRNNYFNKEYLNNHDSTRTD